jgi:hypothetical protein
MRLSTGDMLGHYDIVGEGKHFFLLSDTLDLADLSVWSIVFCPDSSAI